MALGATVRDFLQQADRMPVTLLVAIGYVTMFALTGMHGPEVQFDEVLEQYGWLTPLRAGNGEPWRLLSSAFLHGGLVHIAFNLFALVALGPAIEQSVGSVRFAVVYVVSALGGSVAVCVVNSPFQPVVGGSGALFGMAGCLLAMNMRAGRHLFSFLEFDGPRRLVGLIVLNLVIGWIFPFISNTAHVGGLLAGFLLMFLWLNPGREPSRLLLRYRAALTALFLGLLFASIVPAARFDRLWNRAVGDPSPRGEALRRAAAMDFYDLDEAGDDDVERFILELDLYK